MNIAFLIPEYPHPKVNAHCGGIGTSVKNLVTAMVQQHHKIVIFVYGQERSEVFNDNLIEIHKIKHIKYQLFGWFFYRKYIQTYVNRVVAKNAIQLLEAPDWGGITAFMTFKIPLIIRLHGSDAYFCYLLNTKQKFKNYLFEKQAYKKATAISSVSKYTLEITENIFQIKKKAIVIPNGLYLEHFLTDKIKKSSDNTVLYFGSLLRKKGVLELAEIFNELILINPLATLFIVGRDEVDNIENKPTLQLMTDRLSPKAKQNFNYLGMVSYAEMKTIIENASICVFPSLAESFGMVTIEAMALKKGIVNTNYPWAKEIMIDGETGYLEDPKNHKAFAEKINKLLCDDDLRILFGENARKHVENYFSMEILVQDNVNFYNKVINNEI